MRDAAIHHQTHGACTAYGGSRADVFVHPPTGPAMDRRDRRTGFVMVMAALLLAVLAVMGTTSTAAAQDDPRLTTEPPGGPAGSVIDLVGTGFLPGGYEGIVLWDGRPEGTLTIPTGGSFRSSFRVPTDAIEDEHVVAVCAAERDLQGNLVCTTGDFRQEAETLFVVDGPAQDPPTLSVSPTGGPAGAIVTLEGTNFTPGGYEGLVLWDGAPVDQLKIPDGGRFATTFRIPLDATADEHIISVCAAQSDGGELRCFTNEFAQEAETLFVVDGTIPIRVCKEEVDPCSPFTKATVYRTSDSKAFSVDEDGYMQDTEILAGDDLLWATALNSTLPNYEVYFTSGDPTAVSALFFEPNISEYRIALTLDRPLLLYSLDVSATWFVEGNEAYKQGLRDNLDKAAQYLYDFTDGQMTLGALTVYQSLDNWDETNVRLYASNTLRPNAIVGGIVNTDTADVDPGIVITYTPGTMDMGSAWNRYGVPPGQVVEDGGSTIDTATLTDDWSMAFAHELGHYLLYLFDTYRDRQGNDSAEVAAQCVGSAMGDVYQTPNHAFVADANLWKINCGNTEAYAVLNGRTEWATIVGRYSWLKTPTDPGRANQLPVDLTSVTFIPPTEAPGEAFLAETMALDYVDSETASGEARAFLYRNDRIIEQGKPIAGANQLALTGAQVGDLLCVYDVNDFTEDAGDTPRHQYGCEALTPGDATMQMSKNPGWRPVVTLQQTAVNTLHISVTQDLPAPLLNALTVQIYPEHEQGLTPQPIAHVSGTDFAEDVVLGEPVPPLYVRLFVDEVVAGTTTRRETVLDRGTGGGGLFGPARRFGGVLVYSSDGKATYQRDGDLTLAAGQSIAWQSMAGTPPLPDDRRITGQAYRLDAFPPSLVADGVIQIEFDASAAQATASSVGGTDAGPAVYFYDGETWLPLETTIDAPTAGATDTRLASAPSQGVGIYAVLSEREVAPTLNRIWLPLLRRP